MFVSFNNGMTSATNVEGSAYPSRASVFSWICVDKSIVFCAVFCRSSGLSFFLFIFAIVLSVLLLYMYSYSPFNHQTLIIYILTCIKLHNYCITDTPSKKDPFIFNPRGHTSSCLWEFRSSRHFTCSRHDIAENLLSWR